MISEEINAIQTTGLCKSYGSLQALNKLNVNVPRNSICSLVGPDGAGKTTIIKLLVGLLRPSAGKGTVLGYDIARESLSIRGNVGYLPQELHFFEHMTAREILRFTARFFFFKSLQEIEDRIDAMLALVGVTGIADRPVRSFTPGDRQRLGIAQAVVNDPPLLILDEPAGALDRIHRRDILNILGRVSANRTIFYSTHILSDVQQISDYVIVLNQGSLVGQRPTEKLLDGFSGPAVFITTIAGNTEQALTRITNCPWVTGAEIVKQENGSGLNISVNNVEEAETNLVRIMIEAGAVVTEFRRKQYELEDIFSKLSRPE